MYRISSPPEYKQLISGVNIRGWRMMVIRSKNILEIHDCLEADSLMIRDQEKVIFAYPCSKLSRLSGETPRNHLTPAPSDSWHRYMAPSEERYYVSSCNFRCRLISLYGRSRTYRVAIAYVLGLRPYFV